jgi:hypothetical protein
VQSDYEDGPCIEALLAADADGKKRGMAALRGTCAPAEEMDESTQACYREQVEKAQLCLALLRKPVLDSK